MDADFSHPPEMIPKIIEKSLGNSNSIVIASRYTKNGSIVGWPFKRRLISKAAAVIAKFGLNVNNVTDPMSGFFAVPRPIIQNLKIDTKGYKILLEILVKSKDIQIFEIPYTFMDRKSGKSKMGSSVIFDYISSVWQLYRYGRTQQKK
jgi:dolichol-phosphate mannosyltransferase